ncbi:hypothetical protein SEA_NICEHOUSE_174 [Rhodococcus phage NiceHouse]|nr:hypothetical protein SEA_NICEHOUSE_174 [Rhodococcus phage NiceHouse]
MKTLIGSRALALHIPVKRTPKDVDYFSDNPVFGAEVFYHPDLEKWCWDAVATLDELYTIKVSHSFWRLKNKSFEKHLYDIIEMQRNGAKLIPRLYDILYPIWEQRYGKKKANLNQSASDFFNKQVTRLYDHDSIHATIADGEPLFNKILKDGQQVAVDKAKFDALDHETKIKLVQEEIYATALERLYIGQDDPVGYKTAYVRSLKEMFTSYSKGWFALWIVDNLLELKAPAFDFHQKFLENQHKLIRI